jgi:hypothetical protein
MRGLLDDNGIHELPQLEEAVFNRNYLSGRIAGQTGKPEAFTVVNRRVILGPVPNAVYTYYGSYKRLLGYDTGNPAGTFKVGQMGETDPTKDKPWWPPEHWEVLVVGARALGLKLVNDSAWFGSSSSSRISCRAWSPTTSSTTRARSRRASTAATRCSP